MNKKGQFYLIAAMIFITIILAFVTVTNKSEKDNVKNLQKIADELKIESAALLDNAIYNEKTAEEKNQILIDFTKDFSIYSNVDNIYYIFGNSNILVVAGYRKLSSEIIYIDTGLTQNELILNPEIYNYNKYSNIGDNINLTIKDNLYRFKLINPGENFYFIISGEKDNQEYAITN